MANPAANNGEWTNRRTARTALPLYLVLILAAVLAYATGVHGRSGLSPAETARTASSHGSAGCEEGIFAATAWACLSAGLVSGNAASGMGQP
jgi:hypothetical protein